MFDYNPRYYNEDRQVGDRCFFDGKDVYIDFNADLKSFVVMTGDIDVDYATAAGNSSFHLFQSETAAMEAIAEFYVGGPSYEAVQTNISNLLAAAKHCVIRKDGDVFEYAAVLTDRESEDTEVEPYYLVSLKFAVIRRKPLITKVITQSEVIYNEGNAASGMRISVSPQRQMDTFQVAGITIQNLTPGITYVVDGILGRVTANGVNYFAHTDIIEFPKIQPGRNEIVMSENIPVTVSFYPVFS